MAMFKELNNFDRSGGQGGIGMGTGLLNQDGSVSYPAPAMTSSGGGSSGSYNGGRSNSGYSSRNGPMFNMNRGFQSMGGFRGGVGFGGGSFGGFKRRR
jgi:hypothetical protein